MEPKNNALSTMVSALFFHNRPNTDRGAGSLRNAAGVLLASSMETRCANGAPKRKTRVLELRGVIDRRRGCRFATPRVHRPRRTADPLGPAQRGQHTEPSMAIGPPSVAPMLPLGLAPFGQRYSG